MSHSVWQAVASTPWWVLLIFFLVVRIGYIASKPRIVSFKMFFIFPFILINLSIISLFTIVTFNAANLALWFCAFCIGITLGWVRSKQLQLQAIKDARMIYLPGTWNLLLILLAAFAARYYFGFQTAVNPLLAADPTYAQWSFLLYGLASGVLLGRLGYAYRCIKVGPYYAK